MITDRARVVIVGGGIAGASIAFHLAKLGWRDVVVLEQDELVSGTTSHAPGLVGQLRSHPSLTRMLMHSVSLYRSLRVDGVAGYHEVGSLRLASSKPRLEELKRQAAFAKGVGLDVELLTPTEAGSLFPLMSLTGVEGALLVPSDGSATAPLLAKALLNEAISAGVSVHPRTRVQAVEKSGGRVRAVVTSAGRIETEHLVVACGIWSPIVGRLAGVALPLIPMQHQYAVTSDLPELQARTVPNLRDPDKLVYLRQKDAGFVIGGYERNPRPFAVESIPNRPDPTVHDFDPAHFDPLRRAAAERVPALASIEIVRGVNGLESFTPDGEFLLGQSRDVPGFWAACGFCAHGVSSAGGVGQLLAEWIVSGRPPLDVSQMALDRFGPQASDARFIEQSACKVYGTYYDLRKP